MTTVKTLFNFTEEEFKNDLQETVEGVISLNGENYLYHIDIFGIGYHWLFEKDKFVDEIYARSSIKNYGVFEAMEEVMESINMDSYDYTNENDLANHLYRALGTEFMEKFKSVDGLLEELNK